MKKEKEPPPITAAPHERPRYREAEDAPLQRPDDPDNFDALPLDEAIRRLFR